MGRKLGWNESTVHGSVAPILPVWPSVITMLDEQSRKLADFMLISLEPMTPLEARQAVIVRASWLAELLATSRPKRFRSR